MGCLPYIPVVSPTYHPELLDLGGESLDGDLVPFSLLFHVLQGTSQHADLAIVLGQLLVQLVNLVTVDLTVLLGLVKSAERESRYKFKARSNWIFGQGWCWDIIEWFRI